MKFLFIFLLIPLFLFGQYGNNIIPNGVFDDATGWTLGGTAAISGGTLNLTGDGTTSNIATITVAGYANLDSFKLKYKVTANTLNTSINAIYMGGSAFKFDITGTGTFPTSELTVGNHIVGVNTFASGTIYRHRTLSVAASGTIGFDSVYVYKKLDTLYTDGNQADETDIDTCKTLSEAFETRGSHPGGYFITVAGTYAESITLDSSFTQWSGSNGAVTITQVDFNSVTCTVDERYLTITTKLNDENVTYLNATNNDNTYSKRNNRTGRAKR